MRLTVAFAGLFLLLTGLLITAVLWIVDGTQISVLRGANDADIATVENGFRDEGRDEAVEVVRQIVGSQLSVDAYPPVAYILLEDDAVGKAGR